MDAREPERGAGPADAGSWLVGLAIGLLVVLVVAIVVVAAIVLAGDGGTDSDGAPRDAPVTAEDGDTTTPADDPTRDGDGAAPAPDPTPSDPVAAVRDDDPRVLHAGRVVEVVDGDTVDLDDGTRVRLAIVDTPEVHGGRERCGPEASAFTAEAVEGQQVLVVRPADAPVTGAYGRTIGEVVRADGWSLNVALVAAGLATVDERYTDEDPDLARRARAAAATAPRPSCAPTASAPGPGGDRGLPRPSDGVARGAPSATVAVLPNPTKDPT